jgi:hypothetical protein
MKVYVGSVTRTNSRAGLPLFLDLNRLQIRSMLTHHHSQVFPGQDLRILRLHLLLRKRRLLLRKLHLLRKLRLLLWRLRLRLHLWRFLHPLWRQLRLRSVATRFVYVVRTYPFRNCFETLD